MVLLLDFPAPDLVHYPPKPKRVKGAVDALFGGPAIPRYKPKGATLAELRERLLDGAPGQRGDTGARDLDEAQGAHEVGEGVELLGRAGDLEDEAVEG